MSSPQSAIGLPQRTSDPQQDLLSERLNLLRDGSKSSVLMSLLVSGVLTFLLIRDGLATDFPPLYWFLAMGVTLVLRGGNVWRHSRSPDRLSAREWLIRYHAYTSLTGAAWGLGGALYYGHVDPIIHMLTVLVVAGVAAASMAVLVADYVIYRSFVLLCLLPVAVIALISGVEEGIATGLLILVLVVFLIKSGRRTADAIARAVVLAFQNEDLITQLQKEKEHVVNEAKHMVGTILANVPLTIWSTDRHGVISFKDDHQISGKGIARLPAIGCSMIGLEGGFADLSKLTEFALKGTSSIEEIALEDRIYEVHGSALKSDDDRVKGMVGVAIDITERKHQEHELLRRANLDSLTGLANRSSATSHIAQAIARADRSEKPFALFFLDLDNFKTINDSLGHQVGDTLLCHVADRLREGIRKTDFVARLGGDEFMVLAEEFNQVRTTETFAHNVVDLFKNPFAFEGRELFSNASVGIAVYPKDGANPEELLKSADAAMYQAKLAGRNSYQYFSPELNVDIERHLEIETELRRAIERDEFSLVYQPQVDTQTGKVCVAEALLRWNSNKLGVVSPDEFIPVAELAGILPNIGSWVLHQACRDATAWHDIGYPIKVAVNISPQQFRRRDLLAEVESALGLAKLSPESLELEITENLLMQKGPDIQDTFNNLKAAGITLAIDDFGTGYSALGYLKDFPLQVLKIDKNFIQELGKSDSNNSLVQAIIAMAHGLDLSVVAEGVETPSQLAYLRSQGVQLAQGYLFTQPIPQQEFIDYMSLPQPVPCIG